MTDERFKELVKDGFYVKVNNKKEAICVLEMCEKYDIRWFSGKKATKYMKKSFPYFLHIFKESWEKHPSITYSEGHHDTRHKRIDVEEFTYPKQEIHITRKGDETHAILKEDGKVIKHTVTKCHPEDEFNFEIGSSIACGRLFPIDEVIDMSMIYDHFKQIEKEMNKTTLKTINKENKPQFKVGDIVRIRQWDDMVKEFGISKSDEGSIHCTPNITFTFKMRKHCGELCEIASINENVIELDFLYKDFGDVDFYTFTTDMIELYHPRQAELGEYVMIIKDFENSVFKKRTIVKRTGVTEYEYVVGDKSTEFTNIDGISTLLSPKDYVILKDYKPPLNCRFVVGNNVEGLTTGKIYEVKDGVFKDDDGEEFPCLELGDEPLHTLDDLQEFIGKAGAGHYTDEVVKYIILKD